MVSFKRKAGWSASGSAENAGGRSSPGATGAFGPAPSRSQRDRRWRLGVAFVAAATLFFLIGLFVIDRNQAAAEVARLHERLSDWVRAYPLTASAGFFAAYVLFTSLSLPGSAFLSLLGGGLFGVIWGVLLISFAATTGASLAFLICRYLLRESMSARYGHWLEQVNRELDRDGVFYLLSLRLNPMVPFFLINIVFGLTRMPLWRFWWVTQLGMLPGNFLFTYAGQQLAESGTRGDFLNWKLIVALAALSLFPIVMRKLATAWLAHRRRRHGACETGPRPVA